MEKAKRRERTESRDFRLLLAMTVVTALAGAVYVATENFIGPNYEKPSELYLTYFDRVIYGNESACFSFKLVSPQAKKAVLFIEQDGAAVASELIDYNAEHHRCVPSDYGVHSVAVIADSLRVSFDYEKKNESITAVPDSGYVDVFLLSSIRKVNVSLHNGLPKTSVYLVEFSYQTEYVELRPYETKMVQKIQPVYDGRIYVMGKEFAVKGSGGGINLLDLALGLALMLLPGFILFYDRTVEGTTKALMFSFASFALITLVANQFLSLTREALMALSLVIIGASIVWKKR
ncbi:MAG: hypothetical protein QXO69_01220 [archaeon]